ncbi:MAG: preprotein translocase subunit Sec61beta [archaeon]
MVKLNRGPGVSGPSSAIGIMRFFDVDSGGPKITPEFILGIVIVFIAIVMILKFLF